MNTTAQSLLAGLPLHPEDAARLTLEMLEELQLDSAELTRTQLLARLRRLIRVGLRTLNEEEATVPFAEAAWKSVEARVAAGRRPVTLRDLRYMLRRLLRIPGLAERPLRAMRPRECRELLTNSFGHTPSGFRKARAILHSVFAFGRQQGWCDANPVDCIACPSVAEKEILPLGEAEIERLERTSRQPEHAPMRLSLHLMLYCGIRPTEVRRLRPADFNWDEGTVRIRPSASKTGGGRVVPLRLRRSARRVPMNPILPRDWEKRWRALRRAAGFSHWVPDVLRHTFASYHAAHFRNLPALQLEMGHRDCSLLRSRYVNAAGITRAAAARFFMRCGVVAAVPSS